MQHDIYILGGHQTDFSINWAKRGHGLFEMMQATVLGGLADTKLEPEQVDSSHIGNFAGELFAGQGHLGGFMASIDSGFSGKPSSRHEAACASGSVAVTAAMNEILAGHSELSCVVGVELMRNVSGQDAADHLGAAAWRGKEALDARYLWPHMFSTLMDEYEQRFGLDESHLVALSKLAYDNARKNPLAQTRAWTLGDGHFSGDQEVDPRVEGRILRHDCGQVTDGAVAVFLASEKFAAQWARRHGFALESVARISGFGHRTGCMSLSEKLAVHEPGQLLFRHVALAAEDARKRAGIASIDGIDAVELHDCFTITAYALIEHLGIAEPGKAWSAIESGDLHPGGRIPMNPGGGLIGAGHPVGATGVRMLLDAHKQVTNTAGETQVEGARTVQTLNIGGSATTAVSFVVSAAS
jgi:acetyl-CoA C-acetyltransferase